MGVKKFYNGNILENIGPNGRRVQNFPQCNNNVPTKLRQLLFQRLARIFLKLTHHNERASVARFLYRTNSGAKEKESNERKKTCREAEAKLSNDF